MPYYGVPVKFKKAPRNAHLKMLLKNGQKIVNRIFEKNPYYGARTGVLVGPQGTGKTTALAGLGLAFNKMDYLVIWREIELAQFNRIEATGAKVKVYAHELDDVEIIAMYKGSSKTEEYSVDLIKYRDAEDLYSKVRKGFINVVIEPSYYIPSQKFLEDVVGKRNVSKNSLKNSRNLPSASFWIELKYVLIHRKDRLWVAVLEDEADDIYPAIPTGIEWTMMKWAKDQVKQLRKSFGASYIATQSYSNLNWEVTEKYQDLFLLKGARKPKRSRVLQSWLDDDRMLSRGMAIVESEGLQGVVSFKPLPNVEADLQIIREWQGERPTLEEIFMRYGFLD